MATDNKQGNLMSSLGTVLPQAISGIGSGFIGMQGLKQGTAIQVAGANMSADAYTLQGAAAIQAGQYNVQLDQLKTDRMIESVNRQFSQLIGQQRTAMAATGLRSSSKSFLQVANETLNVLTNEVVRIKDDAHQRQEAIMFKAASAKVTALNQASAAAFQGRVAEFQAGVERAKAIGGAIGSAASLGGAFV
jgi:hypothetical protein